MSLHTYPTRRLFTNEEFLLAQRAWDRIGMDDPTLDYPQTTDADEPIFGTDDAFAVVTPEFPPLSCQCGAMSVKGTTADELTREWVAMDFKDHHLGRPCGTRLVTL